MEPLDNFFIELGNAIIELCDGILNADNKAMSYKTLESLFEKYSRIQMIGPVGSGKSRLLREFAENHPNVALSS